MIHATVRLLNDLTGTRIVTANSHCKHPQNRDGLQAVGQADEEVIRRRAGMVPRRGERAEE